MNGDGANAAGLAAKLDALVGSAEMRRQKVLGFVVFVSGDAARLEALAREHRIRNIGLAYLQDGRDFSPERRDVAGLYKLNPQAKNTVIVYNRKGKVVANFADLTADAFDEVAAAVQRAAR